MSTKLAAPFGRKSRVRNHLPLSKTTGNQKRHTIHSKQDCRVGPSGQEMITAWGHAGEVYIFQPPRRGIRNYDAICAERRRRVVTFAAHPVSSLGKNVIFMVNHDRQELRKMRKIERSRSVDIPAMEARPASRVHESHTGLNGLKNCLHPLFRGF